MCVILSYDKHPLDSLRWLCYSTNGLCIVLILTADILNHLEGTFEHVWLSKGGQEVNVTCPYCASRIGSADGSGHLGLNFSKDAAHCVRCDWGSKGMRKWLKKMGFAAIVPAHIARATLSGVRKQLEHQQVPYRLGQCSLPSPIARLSRRNYDAGDDFAQSMVDKNISLEEVRRNGVCYCDGGRYDGYVIFPFVEDDQIVYWQARAAYPQLLENSKLKKRNPRDDEALFGKSYWLYGYDFARIGGTACLVEGTLDQVTTQSWIEDRGKHLDGWYALSLQGTAVSEPDPSRHPLNSQVGKLVILEPEKVLVVLDPEAWKKTEALAEHLRRLGFNADPVRLPRGDPNETTFDQFDQSLGATGLDVLRNRLNNAQTL
jgi:hypothetical protein